MAIYNYWSNQYQISHVINTPEDSEKIVKSPLKVEQNCYPMLPQRIE